jgi:hypothetical protein
LDGILQLFSAVGGVMWDHLALLAVRSYVVVCLCMLVCCCRTVCVAHIKLALLDTAHLCKVDSCSCIGKLMGRCMLLLSTWCHGAVQQKNKDIQYVSAGQVLGVRRC